MCCFFKCLSVTGRSTPDLNLPRGLTGKRAVQHSLTTEGLVCDQKGRVCEVSRGCEHSWIARLGIVFMCSDLPYLIQLTDVALDLWTRQSCAREWRTEKGGSVSLYDRGGPLEEEKSSLIWETEENSIGLGSSRERLNYWVNRKP